MAMISTARGDIHYKDYRKDHFDGIPYVLIHGAGSQYMDFHPTMRRRLQAIALDLPGHGLSPKREPISINDYTHDVVAFLDAMSLDKVTIIGHSMGGGIAQEIAIDFPQYVHSLILIATGAKLEVNQTIIDGIIEKPEETAHLITKWSWGKSTDERMLQQGVKHLLQTPVETIQADYIACNNFDVRERLSTIQTATLVIAGAKDKMTQLAWNQELAENIPNARLSLFEDAGHMVHVTHVDAVVNVIREWVTEL